MPEPVTSFGATVSDGWLYVYGGNTGQAHEFNRECVKGDFFRLPMPAGVAWEKLPGGLHLLSCPLVSDEGKVIRIGGMTAQNEKGAKSDLRSTDEVVRFDPATQQWDALPKLPESRSSHDAAILDHTLYVGGGWNITGGEDEGSPTKWHDTMLTLDLRAPEQGWHAQPQPFQRRAVAAAAQGGRVWFIGGIDRHDDLSSAVDWFEPATGQWGKGPELPSEAMAGFGAAACVQSGKLYVSPLSGKAAHAQRRWHEMGGSDQAQPGAFLSSPAARGRWPVGGRGWLESPGPCRGAGTHLARPVRQRLRLDAASAVKADGWEDAQRTGRRGLAAMAWPTA